MPGFKSRYCTAKVCPVPIHDHEKLVQFMLDEGKGWISRVCCFQLRMPLCNLITLQSELSQFFRFILPPTDVLEAVVNKRRQYELAERVGMPYATTYYPETLEDVRRIRGSD